MTPRVFCVTYQFLSCGSVFTDGLAHAADDLGVPYVHAAWDTPDLADRIAAFDPDLLFVVHGRRFCSRFPNVRGFGVRTAIWLLDEPYEVDDTSRWSTQFDHVFVNDPATLDRHLHASYLPVCYDPRVQYAVDDPKTQRVGFIGGGNSTRDRFLSALADAELLDYVVGGLWADPHVQRRCISGNIAPAITAKLYRQTRIVLNVFREIHHFNARRTQATSMNPRIYEALACGALVVSEARSEIAERVPEMPTFRTETECVSLVRSLLADPDRAESIRRDCMVRLRGDTYASRLQRVFATIGRAVAA